MPQLSRQTENLISRYQTWYKALEPPKGNVATIHVDEVASKVAAFYEKIRGVIDWREEHLLRRGAIERILKRRFFLGQNAENLAATFVSELIRGGYFPNDRIEETKVGQIQKLLDKYIFIFKNSPPPPAEKIKIQLYDWVFSIAACEAEELLDPPRKERALIEYMEELMKERISVSPQVQEEEKSTQISIAVQKALFKLDNAIISYHLLKKRYPEWLEIPQPEGQNLLQDIAKNIYSIWGSIERDLEHPLAEKFYSICEKYDTPYLIIGDILSGNPVKENLDKPEIWESSIREAYAKRLRQLRSRVGRAAIYSTISIFATKILLAMAIEIPFDRYVTHNFNLQALWLNIAIPPALMFFLVLTIRLPKKKNIERVVIEAMKILFTSEKKDIYPVKLPQKRGIIINAMITLFYLISFIISFGFIWFGLEALHFG
ncbi:MAG: hypothetical protein Q7S60_05820, partial [bacterium]|nr:hypothetical protein [bacterium]